MKLSLETLVSSGSDNERNQYLVLHELQACRKDFSRNRLYPSLAELIELMQTLEGVLENRENLQQRLPRRLKEIDVERKNLVYESMNTLHRDVDRVIELIRWALPEIRDVIEEGRRIYDFVDKNMIVQHVGILPVYREEGYCFVPENRRTLLHVFRFEASLFTAGDERFRGLKVRSVKSFKRRVLHSSLESLKLKLIEEYHDLPAPATFVCDTDLDFPFTETILPIAKRKLMARVFA